MQNENNGVIRNITPEAIENEGYNNGPARAQSSTFDAKNYLNVKLDKDQDEKKIFIRLLTVDKDTNSPFKHIKMHNCQVLKEVSESGFKSYVCLHQTKGKYTEELGDKCPFCEKRNEYFQMYDKYMKEGQVELAKEWARKSGSLKPTEACIVRCIERGKEDEGVKFWKFNLRSDKLDPENQIRKLYNDKKEECEMEHLPIENVLDIDTGYDLKVTIQRKYTNEGKPTDKTTISVSLFGKPKPLTADPELREKWLNDEKIWSDVFVAKPYEYLKIILDGKQPYFDKEKQVWVEFKDSKTYAKEKEEERNGELSAANEAIKRAEQQAVMDELKYEEKKASVASPTISNDEDDDGLPF